MAPLLACRQVFRSLGQTPRYASPSSSRIVHRLSSPRSLELSPFKVCSSVRHRRYCIWMRYTHGGSRISLQLLCRNATPACPCSSVLTHLGTRPHTTHSEESNARNDAPVLRVRDFADEVPGVSLLLCGSADGAHGSALRFWWHCGRVKFLSRVGGLWRSIGVVFEGGCWREKVCSCEALPRKVASLKLGRTWQTCLDDGNASSRVAF